MWENMIINITSKLLAYNMICGLVLAEQNLIIPTKCYQGTEMDKTNHLSLGSHFLCL